jgi:tetratricopeptide (TPR) repeat protein
VLRFTFRLPFFFVIAALMTVATPDAQAGMPGDAVVSVIGWNSLAMWSGSGFVIGDGTWVVTCFHVAARKLAHDRPMLPAHLTVVSPWTGEAVEARVVQTDSNADLALLRLEGPALPALALGDEGALDDETLRDHPPGPVRLSGFPHLEAVADPAVPMQVVSADTDVVAVLPREKFPSLVLAPTPGPQKGWSGGPATWVESGEVTGVFFALVSRDEAPDRWFPHATPIRPLAALLRGAHLDPEALRHPTSVPAVRPTDADARFQHRMHAIIAAMDDRWDRMESEARALLKLTPDSATAHSLLADALAGQGQPAAALREWDEAVRLDPGRAALHAGRGEALLALAQLEAAAAAFRQAELLAPDDADVPLRLAEALERQGRRLDAHQALERAVSLSPNHPLARWALAQNWRWRGYRTAALKEMRQAVELAADLPIGEDFRLGYAAELAHARQIPEAMRQLSELLRRDPEMPAAMLALGRLLADQGRLEEARSLAQQVLANRPEPQAEQAARRLLERIAAGNRPKRSGVPPPSPVPAHVAPLGGKERRANKDPLAR